MLANCRQIACNTLRESIRSKILYSLLFFAALILIVSAFFGTVTIGDQIKVIKDFGLFCASIFSVAFAVISGAALLHKELSRKTVYNILAKPVGRGEFLVGKYLGLFGTTAVLVTLMSAGLFVFVYLFEGSFDLLIWQAAYYMLLELVIVCAAAIFFSSVVVTPMLSGLFSFGIFLAGRSTDYLLYFVNGSATPTAATKVLTLLYWILPHLNLLNVSDQIVFGNALDGEHMIWSTAYALAYATALLMLATFIFRRREFN